MVKRTNADGFRRMRDRIDNEIEDIVLAGMLRVESEAKRIIYLGHPEHLNKLIGNLQKSITTETTRKGDVITASTGSNLSYARIHELGGLAGLYLNAYIPPRPYLTPALEATKEEVLDSIKGDVLQIIKDEAST